MPEERPVTALAEHRKPHPVLNRPGAVGAPEERALVDAHPEGNGGQITEQVASVTSRQFHGCHRALPFRQRRLVEVEAERDGGQRSEQVPGEAGGQFQVRHV
jgi:hypothetical protein